MMQTLKMKDFFMRSIKSKPVAGQEKSTEMAGARSVPIKFRKPTGWTQPIVHLNSEKQDTRALQERITQSKLFYCIAIGMNDERW